MLRGCARKIFACVVSLIVLERVEQLLEQLLARTKARVDDRDVAFRRLAREPDHLLGEIADADRLAHVEREDFAAVAEHRGLQDQLAGLGDRHEVPRDLGMRDRDRARPRGSARESSGTTRARRVEHVAEPDRDEARRRLARKVLAEELGDALARTHDAGRIDGLVGRDQDEAARAVAIGRDCDELGADHVVAERLAHLRLQQGHVLVRRRVEHDLGPRGCEHAIDRDGVGDVAEHGVEDKIGMRAAQLLLDHVEIELADVEDGQRLGAETRDLAAQLRADRAAAAGDQHALAGEPRADRGPVELHRIAAEQVLDRDFLQFVEARAAGDDVFEARHGAERQVAALAQIDRAAHLRLVRGRHRDDEHLGGRLARKLRQLVKRAEHRHAVQAAAAQRCVVVEESDGRVAVVATQVAHERFARLARAEHEHALARRARGEIEPAVLPVAVQESRRAEQHHEHERIHRQHRARHGLEAVVEEQRDRDRERAEHGRLRDVPQIGQAREAPEALVQTRPPEDDALRGEHEPDFRTEPRHRRRIRFERPAQHVDRDPRDPDHQHVVQHDSEARMDRGDQVTQRHGVPACVRRRSTSACRRSRRRYRPHRPSRQRRGPSLRASGHSRSRSASMLRVRG